MGIRNRVFASLASGLPELIDEAGIGAVLNVAEMERQFPHAERWEIIAALKSAQDDGRGRFVVGRRGQPSRFLVGAEGGGDVQEEDEEESEPAMHTFVFRRKQGLILRLPEDITVGEAKRIIKWVETLPNEME